MKKLVLNVVVILITVFAAKTASAQSSTQSSAFTVNIALVKELSASGGTFNYNFSTATALESGIASTDPVTLTYKSNGLSYISINAQAANFTGGEAGNPMPASVIKWRVGNSGSYTNLSNSPADVLGSASSKNARGTGSVAVNYLVQPGLTYAPASDYAINVVYTLTAQ